MFKIPWPPRRVVRYSKADVRLPKPFSVTPSMNSSASAISRNGEDSNFAATSTSRALSSGLAE